MNCTALYSASVDCLKDKSAYLHAYDIVSDNRNKKTDAFCFEKDKFLSLGAEILLRRALHHEGGYCICLCCEKDPSQVPLVITELFA